MRPEDIFEAVGKADDELLLREEKSNIRKRKNIFIRVGAFAASFALIVTAMMYAVNRFTIDSPSEGAATSNNSMSASSGDELSNRPGIDAYTLWVDNREHKEDSVILTPNNAYVWPWDCREIYDQFSEILFDDNRYFIRSTREKLHDDMLGEKLGDATGSGYDIYEEKEYNINCEVYSIKGVSSEHIAAVKYSGYEETYVIIKDEKPEYNTLGEMINSLHLTQNIIFSEFYYNVSTPATHYGLVNSANTELWQIISSLNNAESVAEPEWGYWSDNIISFSLTSRTLGVKNLSFSINSKGYITTNIMNYGHYFYIGEDAAARIIECVLENKTDPPAPTTFKLIGHITEIGEDYIKIDDSVMMKNENDGIVFTVYATDMAVKRYLIRDMLKVGQLVVITHEGIFAENPTEVQTAILLEEASHITENGDVLIPE